MIKGLIARRKGGRDDYSDGRGFRPLEATDGNPRIVITADATKALPDGSLPIHIDWFNIGDEDVVALLGNARDRAIVEGIGR